MRFALPLAAACLLAAAAPAPAAEQATYSQTALAKGLGFTEEEQSTREIVADVIQMRWDGVGTAAEVDVVRKVDCVAQELSSNETWVTLWKLRWDFQHERSQPCS